MHAPLLVRADQDRAQEEQVVVYIGVGAGIGQRRQDPDAMVMYWKTLCPRRTPPVSVM